MINPFQKLPFFDNLNQYIYTLKRISFYLEFTQTLFYSLFWPKKISIINLWIFMKNQRLAQ